jgi:hypothetical protein
MGAGMAVLATAVCAGIETAEESAAVLRQSPHRVAGAEPNEKLLKLLPQVAQVAMRFTSPI